MDISFLVFLLISLHLTSATEQDGRLRLVSQVISDVCSADASTLTEFYRNIRNNSNASVQYPVMSIVKVVNWSQEQSSVDITASYDGFFSDISSNFLSLKREYFKWCVHLYSPDNDTLYGCMKGEERSGSDDFLDLGLFTDFSYSEQFAASLVIKHGEFTNVLQKSLWSVTIDFPWLNHTTTIYYYLILSGEQPGSITSFPRQDYAFLRLGERKMFHCEVFGTLRNSICYWSRDREEVQLVVDVNSKNCTRLWGNFEGPCQNVSLPISYSGRDVDIGSFSNCFVGEEFRIGTRTLSLAFDSPTANDTGEYTCSTFWGRHKSMYISVVFLDFPQSEVSSQNGNSTNLQCTVKAPSNATVYWTFNGQTVTNAGCEYTHTSRTEYSKNSQFSIFQTTFQTCNTTLEDAGRYSCMVDYSVFSLPGNQTAQLDFELTVSHSGYTPVTTNLSTDNELLVKRAVSAMGTIIGASAIILISILVSIAIWMNHVSNRKRRKSMKRCPSNRPPLKPYLYKDEMYVDIYSPGRVKVGEMEFPRENLELQEEIGRGKFGCVYKARAHGIIPNHQQLNLVAVKTPITSDSYGKNLRLLSELELIKKIFRQPHRNICNLLGYCTSGIGPTYIILEFACHGNLKQYLMSCRTAVLELCSDIHIESQCNEALLAESPNLMETLQDDSVNSLNTVSEFPSASNPLSGQVVDCSESSKPAGVVQDCSGFNVVPGVLTMGQLCNFSCQIASGLKHLTDINILHCDLAARNILIAYGGVLKISDFGMARDVSQEDHPYQNLPLVHEEDLVPAKWAAIETLEKQECSFKSEIWSFGVIVWEIASYGGNPYSEFTFGVTFEPFINFLKEGKRLEKPKGLSDNIYQRLCVCWSVDPGLRPTAEDLIQFFQSLNQNTMATAEMPREDGVDMCSLHSECDS